MIREKVHNLQSSRKSARKVFFLGFLIGLFPPLLLQSASTLRNQANFSKSEFIDADSHQNQHFGSSQRNPLTHPNWCPQARCTNTVLCSPCQKRFLIVIATGRSASTTLTWMLNELPGVRMAGENNNTLKAILDMKENVWNHTSFQRGEIKKTAWGHHPIPNQTFACAAQKIIETINPPELTLDNARFKDDESRNDIVGFKTIRFERGISPDHYYRMVDFVKENFPCSRVIVNTNSNTTRQVESYRAAKFGEKRISEKTFIKRNRILKHVSELFGDQAYFLDSAQWTRDVAKLNAAVQWLGFDPSCQFTETLSFNTGGGKGFGHDRTTFSQRDPKCTRLD